MGNSDEPIVKQEGRNIPMQMIHCSPPCIEMFENIYFYFVLFILDELSYLSSFMSDDVLS